MNKPDNISKYAKGFRDRIQPPRDVMGKEIKQPFKDAHKALAKASFAKREREEFFNDAFVDIMHDLFQQWLRTQPHEAKEREYLYHAALSLGDVKSRLLNYETYGSNAARILEEQKALEAQKDNEYDQD